MSEMKVSCLRWFALFNPWAPCKSMVSLFFVLAREVKEKKMTWLWCMSWHLLPHDPHDAAGARRVPHRCRLQKRMPVEGDSSIRQESLLCLCVCVHACVCVCVHALIHGRRAVWYLFVFSLYDLEQHLRLIDQSLCRQTKCGDTSCRLMRCDFW